MMILEMNLMVITEEKLRHRPTTQRERNQPAGDRRTNRTEVMEEEHHQLHQLREQWSRP